MTITTDICTICHEPMSLADEASPVNGWGLAHPSCMERVRKRNQERMDADRMRDYGRRRKPGVTVTRVY